jgi:hypothetical protein
MLMPVTGIFFNRGWTIIRFTRKMLATCDTPVMLVRHPSSDPNRGVGLATAGAILLPLDRRVALMIWVRPNRLTSRIQARQHWHGISISAQPTRRDEPSIITQTTIH